MKLWRESPRRMKMGLRVRSSGPDSADSGDEADFHEGVDPCHDISPLTLHPASTLFFTSLLHCLLLCMVGPRAYLHLSRLSATCSQLSLQISVVCKHHSPQRLLPDLICQPVHHYCKQEGAQSRS